MARYTGKDGFKRIQEILNNRRVRAVMGLGLFASATIASVNTIMNIRKAAEVEFEEEQPHNTYIVQYANTNVYATAPVTNKIQKMQVGDMIQYPADSDSYYNKENDDWVAVSQDEASSETAWISCVVNDTKNDGYIPSKYVNKYLPYSTIDSATFVLEGEQADEIEKIEIQNERVWVFKDESLTENNGVYQAIIRDKKDEFIKGYIDINSLEQDKDSDFYLGVVNTGTFLRDYPLVVELDESNILGQITNGQKVELLNTVRFGREGMQETWHECKIEGQDESVYLMGGTIKNIGDFDMELSVKGNDVPITSKNGSSVRISLYDGNKVMVDKDEMCNGKYQVYVDAGDMSRVGYMDAKALTVYYDEPLIIENEYKEEKETVLKNETFIDEEEYDKPVFVIDLCGYNDIDAFEKTIDDLQKDDMLGGAVFRIGVTSRNNENTNDERVTIVNFVDDAEEYSRPAEDTILLETGYKQIKEKYNGDIIFSGGLGSIKELEKLVELAIDKNVPVGFYYYQGSNNTDRTSVEAAYIYTVISKIKADLGKKYETAMKLPYMIDVEDTSRIADTDRERIIECMNQIELLGKGTNNNAAWCIGDVNPKDGYNVLDDYNNQFTYYGAIMKTCKVSGDSIKYMDEELGKQGYSI